MRNTLHLLTDHTNIEIIQSFHDDLFYLDNRSISPNLLTGEFWWGVVVNVLDCDIVVSEFELQSRYHVHIRINALGKDMNPFIPSGGLNTTRAVILQR